MTAETLTLTEFLLARLAEAEAAARDTNWLAFEYGVDSYGREAFAARVLADVEAKRAVVERCAEMLAVECWEYDDAPKLAEEILCDLATIYAEHPHYNEGWRK